MCLVLIIRICLRSSSSPNARRSVCSAPTAIQRTQRKYAARKDLRSKEAIQREWLCSSGITPIRSVHTPASLIVDADSVLFYTLQSLPAAAGNAEPLSSINRVMAGDMNHRPYSACASPTRSARSSRSRRRHRRGRGVDVSDILFAMRWLSLIHRIIRRRTMDSPQDSARRS